MRDGRRRDTEQLIAVLAPACDRPEDHAGAIRTLLRRGAGEEALVDLLRTVSGQPPAELAAVARSLLRIGIRPTGGFRRRTAGPDICTICEREMPFCWGCGCGFRICQECLEENRWGITCNNITWECPDCGGMRSF